MSLKNFLNIYMLKEVQNWGKKSQVMIRPLSNMMQFIDQKSLLKNIDKLWQLIEAKRAQFPATVKFEDHSIVKETL
jgi:hypothetical protein